MMPTGPAPLCISIPAEVLTSPETGILYPQVERGESVRNGQLLARTTDFFGAPIAEVHSPLDGVVLPRRQL
jgi:predicted deacylase